MRSAFLTAAVALGQVVFVLTIAFGAPCVERCPDDGPDGRCPPLCATCPCSPRPATTASAPVSIAPTTRGEMLAACVRRRPAEPAPADIFHVPKFPLA